MLPTQRTREFPVLAPSPHNKPAGQERIANTRHGFVIAIRIALRTRQDMITCKKLEVHEEVVVRARHGIGVTEFDRELAPTQPVNIDPLRAVSSLTLKRLPSTTKQNYLLLFQARHRASKHRGFLGNPVAVDTDKQRIKCGGVEHRQVAGSIHQQRTERALVLRQPILLEPLADPQRRIW